jgi:hypothetical protein
MMSSFADGRRDQAGSLSNSSCSFTMDNEMPPSADSLPRQ